MIYVFWMIGIASLEFSVIIFFFFFFCFYLIDMASCSLLGPKCIFFCLIYKYLRYLFYDLDIRKEKKKNWILILERENFEFDLIFFF